MTKSVSEIKSTIDKMHTQAECITSLFPWLNNCRQDKHPHNRETPPQQRNNVDETMTRSASEVKSTIDKMHTQSECITSLFP